MARWLSISLWVLLPVTAGCGTLRTTEAFDNARSRLEAIAAADLQQADPYRAALARGLMDLADEARGRGDYDEALDLVSRAAQVAEEVLRSPRRLLQGSPGRPAVGGPP